MNKIHNLKIIRFRINRYLALLWVLMPLLVKCGDTSMPPLPVAPNTPTLPVAVLLPTSGEMAVFGQQLRHGIEMAFDEANNIGGILGRRIQWQFYDTECIDQSTALAVQQAVDDGYLLMIGPLCAASAITAAEYADTEQFLLMVPAAAHPLVTVNGIGETRPTVFRMSHPLPAPGQAIAQFAIDQLHAASSAVITEIGNESSVAAGQAFADQFSSFGGKILAQTALNPYHPDFTTQVEFVLDQRSQALFL
jgi:branched-chain amino acid transport system substrate-binding protein